MFNKQRAPVVKKKKSDIGKLKSSKTLLILDQLFDNNFLATEEIEVIHWSDKAFPNLFDYNNLIVVVPERPENFRRYLTELRLAIRLNINTFWLIGDQSNPCCLEEITNSKNFQLRIPTTDFVCVNDTFKSYFELVESARLIIMPENANWHLIAYFKSSNAPVALQAHHKESVEAVLPYTTKNFKQHVTALKRIGASRNIFLKKFKEPLLLISLLTILTVFTYNEVSIRQSMTAQLARQNPPNIKEKLNGKYILEKFPAAAIYLDFKEKNINPFKFRNTDQEILFAKPNLIPLLAFAHEVNLLALENQVIAKILSDYPLDVQLMDNLVAHGEALTEEAKQMLSNGSFELARFSAQRALNIADKLSESPFARLSGKSANDCRRIIELVRWQFIQGDSVMAVAAKNAFGRQYPLNLPAHRFEKKDLQDNYDYIRLAINHKVGVNPNLNYDSIRILWSEFAELHPDSEKNDEAHFNQINCILDQSWKASGKKLRTLNQEVIRQCDEFVAAFPDSYLADDALRYAFYCALTLSDMNLAANYYFRLAREYPSSDAFQAVLRHLKEKMFKYLEDEKIVMAMDFLFYLAATAETDIVGNTIRMYNQQNRQFGSVELMDILNYPTLENSKLDHRSFIKTFLPSLKKNAND